MIVEIFGVSFVVAVATLAAMLYERRMDVLHGPYIEGCVSELATLADFLKAMREVANDLRWKARNMAYVASVIAF